MDTVLFVEGPLRESWWAWTLGVSLHRKNALCPWDQVCRGPCAVHTQNFAFQAQFSIVPTFMECWLYWPRRLLISCLFSAQRILSSPAFSVFKGSSYLLPYQRSKDLVISCLFTYQRISLSPTISERLEYLVISCLFSYPRIFLPSAFAAFKGSCYLLSF